MVTDRQGPYVPHPVPSWAEVIAEKDKLIEELIAELKKLRDEYVALQREVHVALGRSTQ